MSPLLRKKRTALPRAEASLILDIGSGSAAAALMWMEDGKPALLAPKRVPVRFLAGRNGDVLQSRILKAAEESLQHIERHMHNFSADKMHKKVHHIAVFLPAPWSELELHRLRFAQDSAFLASESLLRGLIAEHAKQEARAIEEREEQASKEIFEQVVAGLRLNGYVSPALIPESKVMHLEMMLATSRAPRMFLDGLRACIARLGPGAHITFHASSLAAAHAVSLLAPDTSTFLLCDGEGELAELLLVRETIPEAHATIPVGFATLLRTLITHGGFSREEAHSALELLADPNAPFTREAHDTIVLAQRECAKRMGEAEPLFLSHGPRVAYLIGDGSEAVWFAGALQKSPRLKSVLPRDFRVEMIGARGLAGHVRMESPTRGDAMLALEALFVHSRFGDARHFFAQ